MLLPLTFEHRELVVVLNDDGLSMLSPMLKLAPSQCGARIWHCLWHHELWVCHLHHNIYYIIPARSAMSIPLCQHCALYLSWLPPHLHHPLPSSQCIHCHYNPPLSLPTFAVITTHICCHHHPCPLPSPPTSAVVTTHVCRHYHPCLLSSQPTSAIVTIHICCHHLHVSFVLFCSV